MISNAIFKDDDYGFFLNGNFNGYTYNVGSLNQNNAVLKCQSDTGGMSIDLDSITLLNKGNDDITPLTNQEKAAILNGIVSKKKSLINGSSCDLLKSALFSLDTFSATQWIDKVNGNNFDLKKSYGVRLNGVDNYILALNDEKQSFFVEGGTPLRISVSVNADDITTNFMGLVGCGARTALVKGMYIRAQKATGECVLSYSDGITLAQELTGIFIVPGEDFECEFVGTGIEGEAVTFSANGNVYNSTWKKQWSGSSGDPLRFFAYNQTDPITYLNGVVWKYGYDANNYGYKQFDYSTGSGLFFYNRASGEKGYQMSGATGLTTIATQDKHHPNIAEGFGYQYPFTIMGDFDNNILFVTENGANTAISHNIINPINGLGDLKIVCSGVEASNLTPAISFNYIAGYLESHTTALTGWSDRGKYKLTFNYRVNSGTCEFKNIVIGSDIFAINETLSGSGVFEKEIVTTSNNNSDLVFQFNGLDYLFDIDIDDLLVNTLGKFTYEKTLDRNVINVKQNQYATTDYHAAFTNNEMSYEVEYIQYNYAVSYGAAGNQDNEILIIESDLGDISYLQLESLQSTKSEAIYGVGVRTTTGASASAHSDYHPPLYSVRKALVSIDNTTPGEISVQLTENGNLIATQTTFADLKIGSSARLRLGDFGKSDSAAGMNIDILSIKYWNKAINWGESHDANLVASYALDESSGVLVDSISGYNFNTIVGATYKSLKQDVGINGVFITNPTIPNGHNNAETLLVPPLGLHDPLNYFYTGGVPNEFSFADMVNNPYVRVNTVNALNDKRQFTGFDHNLTTDEDITVDKCFLKSNTLPAGESFIINEDTGQYIIDDSITSPTYSEYIHT